MKRLTKRYASHVAVICHNCEKEHTPCDIPDCRDVVLNRLAEYEDIGLEPEKIVLLKNIVDDAFSDKPEFTEHIRELLRAEKDGRLVVLPCKVGDRVYQVIDDCTFPVDCGTTNKCKGCEYRNLFIEEDVFHLNLLTDSGKLRRGYYTTREAAEKALEGNSESTV